MSLDHNSQPSKALHPHLQPLLHQPGAPRIQLCHHLPHSRDTRGPSTACSASIPATLQVTLQAAHGSKTTPCSPSKVWSPVLAACTPQWTSTESLFANVFWGPASCNLLDPALGPWVNLANPHCSEELQPPPSWLQLPSSGKGPLKTVPSPLETAAIRPKSPPVSFLGKYSISGAGGPHPQYL